MRADHPQQHIVVSDPAGQYWEGALVSAEADVPILRARGAVTLPVEVDLIGRSAVGGYFRRSWGAGWPIGTTLPRLCCPMVLYILAGQPLHQSNAGVRRIHCALRLQVDPEVDPQMTGQLRLTTDSGQPGVFSGGFSAGNGTCLDAAKLPARDAEGGWNVYLEGTIDAPSNAMVGFALYGAVPNARVAWAAISQSR